jgi:hypothetical protein
MVNVKDVFFSRKKESAGLRRMTPDIVAISLLRLWLISIFAYHIEYRNYSTISIIFLSKGIRIPMIFLFIYSIAT